MVRIFIGLLVGVILGVYGTIQFLSSGNEELLIVANPRARQLEEEVKRANQQIERLASKLESAADSMEKTAAKFAALEQRVRQAQLPPPPVPTAEAVAPTPPPPSAEAPTPETAPQPTESPAPSS